MTEEVIIKVGTTGDGSVDTLNKKLVETGKNANKAESEISKLRKELRDAKGDMLKYAEGTEEYNRALRRASDIQGRMKETNDIVKAGVRDLGATTKLVAGTIGGLASGFQVAQGAMALFGVENDAVLETMMKMQAIMSVTQGIAGFANGFDDLQDLMIGFRANADKSTQAVSELSKVSGEAANNMGNLAKEGAVIGSNLAGTSNVANKLSDALDGVGKKATASKESIIAYKSALDNFIDADVKARTTGSQFDELDKKYALDKVKTAKEQLEASRAMAQAEIDASKAKEDLSKSTEKATSGLKSQLLTMGLWIVAIAAATYAITSLIEFINKIPEDVKVKIEVDTDVFKALGKDLININKFVNDYRKASKDDNKERIKELEAFGKKEFDLNDTRLKQIRDTTEGWKSAFKEYLKIAEDTYWNESIIKRKVEAQQAAITAKSSAIRLFKSQSDTGFMSGKTAQGGFSAKTSGGWTWEQLVEAAQKNDWAGKTDADLRAFGIPQQIIDELRKVILSNEIIKGLPKMRDIDLGTGKVDTGKGSSGTKSTYSPPSLKNIPEVVTAEKVAREQVKWEEYTLAEKTRLQEEQQSISKEIAGRKIPLTGGELNVFQELEYDVRLLKASLEDMNKEYATLSKRKSELEGYKTLFEEESKNVTTIYDTIDKTNVSLAEKQNQLNALLVKEKELEAIYSKSKNAGEAKKNKEAIDSIKGLISAKQNEIDTDKNHLKILEKGLADAKERQSKYKDGSKEYEQISKEMLDLDIAIDAEKESLHNRDVQRHREKINMAKEYLSAISDVFGGLADIHQGEMDLTNALYDQKIWDNEEMIQSDKQRSDKEYEIEMARWEALQENFEAQKKMKEAQAWMDFASGSVGIWTAPGITSLAPFGYILAGIQQAALLATTVGNVKSIRSQQMLKPHKSNGGSASGSSSALTPALNPVKNALTSRDENLNTMSKANQKDIPTSVVKVSEINDVQGRVRVREENSSY